MKLPEMSDLELNQAGSRPWGIDNDYTQLRDVLLGRPDYYRWVEAGPIIGRTLNNADKTGVKFDHALALEQHRNMVQVYEDAGVDTGRELPDHIEVVLRNADCFPEEDWEEIATWCIPGPVKAMVSALKESHNPYTYLLKAVLILFQYDYPQEINHG